MSRTPNNIGDLAQSVLDTVEREQLGVSGSVSYTKKASVSTETGRMMNKIAELIRDEVKNDSVTYDDLTMFLRTYAR